MPERSNSTVRVEVAYARPDEQRIVSLMVPVGTSIREALARSGLPEEFPELDAASCVLGIFGRLVKDQYAVKEGDRVEVYRPLRVDPREARRQLAALGLTMGRPPQRPESG